MKITNQIDIHMKRGEKRILNTTLKIVINTREENKRITKRKTKKFKTINKMAIKLYLLIITKP